MATTTTTTRRILAEINRERWAAMTPSGRRNCRQAYRWMRTDGLERARAVAIIEWTTLAGETAATVAR